MHAKARAAFKRAALRAQPEEDPEFQIAPMIDILLVLLVFFMSISSTEVLQTNDAVHLPVAKDAKDKESKNQTGQTVVNVLWTTLSSSGMIEIDTKKFGPPGDVGPELTARIQKEPMMRILVRADKDVRYEYMKELLKTIAKAGGTNVTFSVTDKEQTPPPGAK